MNLPYSGYLQRPAGSLILYYITNRKQFSGNSEEQKIRLLHKISECAAVGVDYVQLREKDLSARSLQEIAAAAVKLLPHGSRTKLLINSRTDVALASAAHGVHLPAGDLAASEARAIFAAAGNFHPIIAISTHSNEDLSYAEAHGADFAVFGPIFEKDSSAVENGLQRLKATCTVAGRSMPVVALGGITVTNARDCIAAGANGIAAIRLFQEIEVARVVAQLRASLISDP